MIACYDLARCPPTFDAVAFLALAEVERLRRGDDHLDLYILPGPVGGFRGDDLWPHTIEERVRVRDNVLVPLCRLLPSVRRSVLCTGRFSPKVPGWGRGEYLVGLPRIVEALRAGSRPLRAAPLQPDSGRYITFTLREAAHHPLRNSRSEEWVLAAEELAERHKIGIVVIRDARKSSEPFLGPSSTDRVVQFAADDLLQRAGLYSGAALNVGISNGPMWMSIFMCAPTLMLRPTTNAAQGCYDDLFFRRCGVETGGQLPTSPPHQRLVWQEDTCNNIVRAVEEMLEVQT